MFFWRCSLETGAGPLGSDACANGQKASSSYGYWFGLLPEARPAYFLERCWSGIQPLSSQRYTVGAGLSGCVMPGGLWRDQRSDGQVRANVCEVPRSPTSPRVLRALLFLQQWGQVPTALPIRVARNIYCVSRLHLTR